MRHTILTFVLVAVAATGWAGSTPTVEANRAEQERLLEQRMTVLKEDPQSLYFARTTASPAEQEQVADACIEKIQKLSEVDGFDSPDHEAIVEQAKLILRQAPDTEQAQMAHWNIHSEFLILEQEDDAFEALETYVSKYPDDIYRVHEAFDRLANWAADRGDWGLSLYYIDRYLAEAPDDPARLLVRAQALIGLGDTAAGRVILEELLVEAEGTVAWNLAAAELEQLESVGGAMPAAPGAEVAAGDSTGPYDQDLWRAYVETAETIRQTAMAMEMYSIEFMQYPDSFEPLTPDYLESPAADAWGRPLLLRIEGDDFWIASPGSDGVFGGFDQQGTYTDLAGGDLIFTGGGFDHCPQGID